MKKVFDKTKFKTMDVKKWRRRHPDAVYHVAIDPASKDPAVCMTFMRCPRTGEIYVHDVRQVEDNPMPRKTRDQYIDETIKLRDEISDLKDGIKEIETTLNDKIEHMRRKDENRRSQVANILAIDYHATEVQGAALNAQRRNCVQDYSQSTGRKPSFSWEEIFFMIGGLHSTSQYSFKCEEILELKKEVGFLKAESKK